MRGLILLQYFHNKFSNVYFNLNYTLSTDFFEFYLVCRSTHIIDHGKTKLIQCKSQKYGN